MKTVMRAVFLGMALFLAVGAVAFAAPGDQGSWEFGPYVGWAFLDKYDILKPKNDFLAGARLGYFMTSALSIEGSYQILSTETNTASGQREFDLDSVRLNLLWNFREGKVCRPFVTAGGNYDMLDISNLGDSKDVGGNAGGGARWILSDVAALRVDGRYVFHNLDIPEFPNEHQDNFELTAGLSIMLGGGPPKDSDGDGVRDSRDKCPDTPRGATVDEQGCPKDADGDGVFDGLDACPDTPAGCPVDARGCPLDSDGDGVIDCRDKCPNTPRGSTVDAEGCPPKAAAPVFPEGKKELVLQGVYFETDKAEITEGSKGVLDRVAASLKDNPDTKVEIQGHTDSTGGDRHNMQLSEKRAEAVRDYLISKGVPEGQVTAKGYGETQPVADNKTKEGRAQNRRTQMVKVE